MLSPTINSVNKKFYNPIQLKIGTKLFRYYSKTNNFANLYTTQALPPATNEFA